MCKSYNDKDNEQTCIINLRTIRLLAMHKLENGKAVTELKEIISNNVENKKLKNEGSSLSKNKEGLYKNKDASTINNEKHKHKEEKLEQNARHNAEIQKSPNKRESIKCNPCFIDKYFEQKIFAAYDYACRRSKNKKPNEKFSKMKACRRICLLFIPPILFILCPISVMYLGAASYIYTALFSIGSTLMIHIFLKIIIYACLASKKPSNSVNK
ncbi:Plasmodium exported protein (Pm-fam-a like), unknown function [Plasmodium ovale wallikeri]|uniref:Uncharacterized protein n=1 Tax=Plasmodium ovale wallikeri TaxID=864142 RepID=A0A1A9AI68_PLAOA|nr:Plasmodium exported protein (Pm-fam-a like), unknown function [Plasmodium ovale wallikeri]